MSLPSSSSIANVTVDKNIAIPPIKIKAKKATKRKILDSSDEEWP